MFKGVKCFHNIYFYLLFNIFGTWHGYFSRTSAPPLLDFSRLCLEKADKRKVPTAFPSSIVIYMTMCSLPIWRKNLNMSDLLRDYIPIATTYKSAKYHGNTNQLLSSILEYYLRYLFLVSPDNC